MVLQHIVEDRYIAVEREAQVAYASLLALLHQPVQQSVVQEALAQVVHPATAYAVQQQIVDIVGLQVLQAVLEYLAALLEAVLLGAEVGELRSYIVRVSRASALLQGDAQRFLALSAAVGWRRVEVVHTVLQGVVRQSVHLLLVDNLIVWAVAHPLGRQSHPSVAQYAHLVARLGIRAIGHLVGWNGVRMVPHRIQVDILGIVFLSAGSQG